MSLTRGHLNLNSLISSEIYFYCTVVAVQLQLYKNSKIFSSVFHIKIKIKGESITNLSQKFFENYFDF